MMTNLFSLVAYTVKSVAKNTKYSFQEHTRVQAQNIKASQRQRTLYVGIDSWLHKNSVPLIGIELQTCPNDFH